MRDAAPRPRIGAAALLGVLAAHGLLLWMLSVALAPVRRAAPPPQRVTLRLIAPPAPPRSPAAPPRPRERDDARAVAPRAITVPRAAQREEPALTAARQAALSQAEPPASAPPTSSPSLLDTEATRRAIRASARAPSITAQAAQVTGEPRAPSAQERLGNATRAAGIGDCAKGEYAGAGMGLLSLPFLAAAVTRGACAQ